MEFLAELLLKILDSNGAPWENLTILPGALTIAQWALKIPPGALSIVPRALIAPRVENRDVPKLRRFSFGFGRS